MGTLKQFVLFRWLLDLKKTYARRKQKKKIEYCERQWEMRLRGLKR